VQIGIAMLQDEERFAWNVVMAGVVIVMIPTFLLFIFGNRQLIRGLTAGAVKG
jgi:sn-glycerol 3-phosphate transport system permease protein